jgi:hypothetical protein
MKQSLAPLPRGEHYMYESGNSTVTTVIYICTEFMATDLEVRVRFLALPNLLSSGSGMETTQPREHNSGTTSNQKWRFRSRNPRIRP